MKQDAAEKIAQQTAKITAKAEGDTYVFAMIENGKYDFCKVSVVDQDTYDQLFDSTVDDIPDIELEEEALENADDTAELTPTITPMPTVSPTAAQETQSLDR